MGRRRDPPRRSGHVGPRGPHDDAPSASAPAPRRRPLSARMGGDTGRLGGKPRPALRPPRRPPGTRRTAARGLVRAPRGTRPQAGGRHRGPAISVASARQLGSPSHKNRRTGVWRGSRASGVPGASSAPGTTVFSVLVTEIHLLPSGGPSQVIARMPFQVPVPVVLFSTREPSVRPVPARGLPLLADRLLPGRALRRGSSVSGRRDDRGTLARRRPCLSARPVGGRQLFHGPCHQGPRLASRSLWTVRPRWPARGACPGRREHGAEASVGRMHGNVAVSRRFMPGRVREDPFLSACAEQATDLSAGGPFPCGGCHAGRCLRLADLAVRDAFTRAEALDPAPPCSTAEAVSVGRGGGDCSPASRVRGPWSGSPYAAGPWRFRLSPSGVGDPMGCVQGRPMRASTERFGSLICGMVCPTLSKAGQTGPGPRPLGPCP